MTTPRAPSEIPRATLRAGKGRQLQRARWEPGGRPWAIKPVGDRKPIDGDSHAGEPDDPPHEGAAAISLDLDLSLGLPPLEDPNGRRWITDHRCRSMTDGIETGGGRSPEFIEEEPRHAQRHQTQLD